MLFTDNKTHKSVTTRVLSTFLTSQNINKLNDVNHSEYILYDTLHAFLMFRRVTNVVTV